MKRCFFLNYFLFLIFSGAVVVVVVAVFTAAIAASFSANVSVRRAATANATTSTIITRCSAATYVTVSTSKP